MTAKAFRLPLTSDFFTQDITVRTMKAAVQMAEIIIGTTKRTFLKWLPVNVTASPVEFEYRPLMVALRMFRVPLAGAEDWDAIVTLILLKNEERSYRYN